MKLKFLKKETKYKFLIKNILKGLLWLGIVIIIFMLTSRYIQENFMSHINKMYINDFLFYGLFTVSEIIFGLIPPEFFMMVYILHKISLMQFIANLFILTLISYGAGILNYFIGRNFANTAIVIKINEKFLMRYKTQLTKYGKYLLIAGAVTPLPFSAVCMLTGLVKFPINSFLLISTTRMLRFAVYGLVLWNIPNSL